MLPLMFAALLAASPAGTSADTVVGLWKTQTRNGTVSVQKCGASICGTIVTSDLLKQHPDQKDVLNKDETKRGRVLEGLTILSGFHQDDGGVWSDGQVYNPDDGRTYSGKITPVDANHLKLRGCVFVPLCKTETWTRIQ